MKCYTTVLYTCLAMFAQDLVCNLLLSNKMLSLYDYVRVIVKSEV